jgi:hypothetical protein
VAPEVELSYSSEKIQENFSNYSAFHHRSLYIKKAGQNLRDILPAEFSTVENAIFTEPDDQSAWWYHQFLVSWMQQDASLSSSSSSPPLSESNAAAENAVSGREQEQEQEQSSSSTVSAGGEEERQAQADLDADFYVGLLLQQLEVVRGLHELEPRCIWAMTCLASVQQVLCEVPFAEVLVRMAAQDGAGTTPSPTALRTERTALLEKLIEVDPIHQNRYKFMLLSLK